MAITTSLNSVDPRPIVRRLTASSNGLSTSGANYTPNTQLGGEIVFPNATRTTSGFGTISSATLVDNASSIGAIDLYMFSRSVTPAANKSAANFSDSDMDYYIGTVSFPAPTALINNSATSLSAIGLTYQTNATSLYGYIVTLTQHGIFNAGTDIKLSLTVYQY